jgi:ribosomal protein S18 acetylase RimI-like enzyme
MVSIYPITPENAMMFKELRLRALQDTPKAFGSTYARESLLTDREWMDRAARWNGERSILYIAMDNGDGDGVGCGIAGTLLDQDDPTRAHLISMWTAPEYRQRGVGRMLVSEVIGWARLRGASILQLLVTSENHPARQFYQRLGFVFTGRTEPYPNDPALVELEMSLPIV